MVLTGGLFTQTSCVKDLDVKPIDKNVIASSNLAERENAMVQALAKCYSSFAVPGQSLSNGDIAGIDNGFGVYTRALWMLQELTTDEVVCSWNDQTIKDYHWQTWSKTDVFNAAMYSRIIYVVTLTNEFIRNSAGSSDPKIAMYNAEARFLRALAYYHAIDMYGNPAFITEADKPGTFYPKQTTRTELFAFVEKELKDIETKLGEPRFEYGRADKAAAWMLLARMYLNAKVYINTEKWDDCITYSEKVIKAGYTLDPFYNRIFAANNNTSPEMIFAINYDGTYTQSYGGTTYIIHAACSNTYMDPVNGLGVGSGWEGNRAVKEFAHILVDTVKYPPTVADRNFTAVKDKRVMLTMLGNWDMVNVGTFHDGIGVRKFSNMTHDGKAAEHPHSDFTCTDYPIFRLADAYLMRAEALVRKGDANKAKAMEDINLLRQRAYGDASGNVTAAEVTLDFICDERARELYWEGVRRTDLIRFDKFTSDKYVWTWKGNTFKGKATESYRSLFPIPASEVANNPNMKQNPGY
jgi:starch-binding outer membrane protein, SusD/RagB family